MKKIKNSFLFFCFIILCLFLSTKVAYSQAEKDSSNYYYYKIINPKQNLDLPSGYLYYNKLKIKNLINKDTVSAIANLRMIAICQFKLGLIYESEESAIEALSLLDFLKIKDAINNPKIGLYNHLGKVYRATLNYDKALEVYDKALQLSISLKDSITIINNKANVYTELQDYENAINQFTIVYNKSANSSNKLQLARVLNNLGYVQSKIDSIVGLNNINKALKIRIQENDIIGIYSSYRNLTQYYLDRNNNQKALFYANKGFETVKSINSSAYTQDALSLFMELDDNPKIVEYKRLTDSITKAEQIGRNSYSFNKYRYDKQEKIAQENSLQREKEKQLKLIYLGLAIFILLLLISSYFIFKARNKKEKLEQVYKTETRISKKIHDEVANDVYQVMTKLQNEKDINDIVLDDLESIYLKTRDISKENSAIDVNEHFNEVLNDLLLSYKTKEVTIITKNISKIDWNTIAKYKKTTIYRILQELMTNMKKHSAATLVVLTFTKENNKLTINYTDNGIGCELKKQVGLQNTETRMESINGSINFETKLNKGFKAKISI